MGWVGVGLVAAAAGVSCGLQGVQGTCSRRVHSLQQGAHCW